MSKRKVLAVVGATGAQGGGLARAVLNDPERTLTVRALTRDVNSPAARELARLGAEVVAADLDRPATIERAFAGASAAFCVTFYWAHASPEKEMQHAATMARAAKDAGVEHVIWSTLEDTRRWVPLDDKRMPTLMGRYKVPHFDAKGEADRFFTDLGVPVTFLLASFYWENFIRAGMGPKRGEDGILRLTLPMGAKKLPGIAVDHIGKCAYGILRRGGSYIGRAVGIAGEHLSGAEMASALGRALGEEVRYEDISPDAYRSLGFPGAEDLGNMFQFNRDFNDVFRAARDPRVARELNPELQTFDQWLSRNAKLIPVDRTRAAGG